MSRWRGWFAVLGVLGGLAVLGPIGCGDDDPDDHDHADDEEETVENARIREIVIAWRGARGAGAEVVRTREEAQALVERLRDEARLPTSSFPVLAWDHSDHESWRRGGDRMRFDRERHPGIADAVAEAAFELEEGDLSSILEADDGFHLFKRIGLAGDNEGKWLREQRGVAHIQVADRAVAEVVLELVAAGDLDWGTLVLQHSEDRATRQDEGRLRRYRRRRFGTEFDKVVHDLKPGQTAEAVVAADDGSFHILRRLPD